MLCCYLEGYVGCPFNYNLFQTLTDEIGKNIKNNFRDEFSYAELNFKSLQHFRFFQNVINNIKKSVVIY